MINVATLGSDKANRHIADERYSIDTEYDLFWKCIKHICPQISPLDLHIFCQRTDYDGFEGSDIQAFVKLSSGFEL